MLNSALTRRSLLCSIGAGAASSAFAGFSTPSTPRLGELRREIVDSPLGVALHRARVFTRVFQQHESKPWILRKGMALREYFRTVPLYLRSHDRIAGSLTETPGAMPVIVEVGIGENRIYLADNPKRSGYLKGQIPREIWDYWLDRNLWGRYRAENPGSRVPQSASEADWQGNEYKFISNQGHLSPSFAELLAVGLGGLRRKVARRRTAESDPEKTAFLDAAAFGLEGLSDWMGRYAEFLRAEAARATDAARAADLREMSRIAAKVSTAPPETFREALQLIWFAHQSIHIEGHGYATTPDFVDRLLYPYYAADVKAGRLDDRQALEFCENFTLKMYDNTFWGPEHRMTWGLCLGGSTPDGKDLTNRLSRLFVEGSTNMALPEPLVWIRWHPKVDQEFFDFCLSRLARGTCYPMMRNDTVVAAGLMALGVSREDAYNYIPVGCNELAIPGQFYFNPNANVNYLRSMERTLMSGKGYTSGSPAQPLAPPASELKDFDSFVRAFGAYMRDSVATSYRSSMRMLKAQMEYGQTPLTSCFFDGCVERGRDMILGTKYNILSCGGSFFANAVDSVAAIREVVYEKKQATLEEVAAACQANFQGCERLRARLLAAPKHGNDDPRLDSVIALVERLRDEPMKEICRDPRDGTPFGNCHIVRHSAVVTGRATPATPDGRLAGAPLASSVASCAGHEKSGPTAVLNSVARLNAAKSWQTGYQVNLRFQGSMLSQASSRAKVRAMLNVYFQKGGQQLQINAVDNEMLRAAQKNPEQYRDLVVRIAGFSEFFVNLTPDMQEELISRTAHT